MLEYVAEGGLEGLRRDGREEPEGMRGLHILGGYGRTGVKEGVERVKGEEEDAGWTWGERHLVCNLERGLEKCCQVSHVPIEVRMATTRLKIEMAE